MSTKSAYWAQYLSNVKYFVLYSNSPSTCRIKPEHTTLAKNDMELAQKRGSSQSHKMLMPRDKTCWNFVAHKQMF